MKIFQFWQALDGLRLKNKFWKISFFSFFVVYEKHVLSPIERNFHFFHLNCFLNETLTFREKKSPGSFFDWTALSALIIALKFSNFAICSKSGKKEHERLVFGTRERNFDFFHLNFFLNETLTFLKNQNLRNFFSIWQP